MRTDRRIDGDSLGKRLGPEENQHDQRSGDQRRHQDKRSGANEVERREQPEGKRAQAADQRMVLAHGSGQHHANHVRRQHRFAAGPDSQAAHGKERKEKVLGFDLGDAPAKLAEEPRRNKGQEHEDRDRDRDEDQRLDGERREDQSQCNHGSDVVDEASGENRLPVLGDIEAQLQHDGIDHGNRGGGKSDAAEPTGHYGPMEHVMRDGRAAEKRPEESRQSDDRCFAPLGFEDHGIEFRAGKKGEHDSSRPRQKLDPLGVAQQSALPEKRDDH